MTPQERDKLILDNQGLIESVIRLFPIHKQDRNDARQAGIIGLCEAADSYDPAKGAFSTHAFWKIRTRVAESHEQSKIVKTPRDAWTQQTFWTLAKIASIFHLLPLYNFGKCAAQA